MKNTTTMPAEWELHRGMLMEWPVSDSVWADGVDAARAAFAKVAQAIARFEPLTMIANPELATQAANLCGNTVTILPLAHDDCWVRDNGPTFVKSKESGELVGINWHFNAWGSKFPSFALDNTIPERLLSHWSLGRIDAPIILEGGSIHTNGAGTLLTTAECLLNPNRNPSLSKDELAQTLMEYLGVERIVWLPYGLDGDETDGHVDNVCCFLNEDTVLLQWTDDKTHPNYDRVHCNLEVLQAAGLKVEKMIQPPTVLHNGEPLTLSYVNFVYVNGGIVMPSFGGDLEESDKLAYTTMQRLFPNREIVAVATLDIIKGGGNIHCITQQVPR